MDNFKDKLKDIIYSLGDYLFIIVIIAVVGGVIAWRLDLLFNKNYASEDKEVIEEIVVEDTDKTNDTSLKGEDSKENPKEAINKNSDDKLEESSNDKEKSKEELDNKTDSQDKDTVTVEIPKGSVSTTIGDILAEKGLVHDSKSFVDKATELGKETKLKSGTFEIPNDISIEGVIEIITK